MPYALVIKKQAKKFLENLSKTERIKIVEKIILLGNNPDDPRLDIKKLIAQAFYRLRVGNWRIVFDRNDQIKIISIEKIKSRGDIYK